MASSDCIFVILATARTGSTLLETMLNSHPDTIVGGELLDPVVVEESGEIRWPKKSAHHERIRHDAELSRARRDDPVAFLSAIGDLARSESYRVFGFKLLYEPGHCRSAAVEHLTTLQDLRVIHLKRRDQIRRYVSLHRAMTTGERRPLTIDPDECLAELRMAMKVEREFDELFDKQSKLEIWYEDITANPPVWSKRVQEYLTLEPRKLETGTLESDNGSLRASIANYDELKANLATTEWSHLFTE